MGATPINDNMPVRRSPTGFPSTIVLDREHRVAAVFLRELLAADLLPVVQRLAAEPRPQT